jgi:alpha-ketoglutarate-dependent taurine dioxygenase
MKISKIPGLGRFGVYIDDVNLETISIEQWMEIGQLHLHNLVTIIRQANCSKDRFSELVLKFGEQRNTTQLSQKYYKKYKKDWQWIVTQFRKDSDLLDREDKRILATIESLADVTSNGNPVGKVAGGYDKDGKPNGWFADGELDWHSNESGTLTFTPGLGLLGYKGVVGSATGFLATPDYYESVSNSFRSELDEMVLLHRFMPGKINPGLRQDQDEIMRMNFCPDDNSEVPMVIQSPGGIRGLHYSLGTVYQIKGMSKANSDQVFKEINANLVCDKYVYDHWYQNDNDLLLFDNSITMHRRLGNIDGRLCYRIPFDYTNLQSGPWQPYYQKDFAQRYSQEIRKIISIAKIENFKFPKKTWKEYVPVLKNYV